MQGERKKGRQETQEKKNMIIKAHCNKEHEHEYTKLYIP